MATKKPSGLLYCYLREKFTTLEIITADGSEDSAPGRRDYVCHGRDALCSDRRCRLSDGGREHPEGTRDPWFDE